MTPLTVKLLTPHDAECSAVRWTRPAIFREIISFRCEDCGVEVEIDAPSLDRAIAEALEEQG